MSDQRRFEKTLDKALRGDLPAPSPKPSRKDLGDGSECDGCDETVTPTEGMITVTVGGSLRFHESCYAAWSTFRP